MDDFLITTLYEYNRISAEDYLLHSWGKKPEQKRAEKKYNHWYYEKFKDRWKTKYNKNTSSKAGSAQADYSDSPRKREYTITTQPKHYTGSAYAYRIKTTSEPHLDSKSVDVAKKMTRALKIGADAVIGIGGLIGGAALMPIVPALGVGAMVIGAAHTYSAGKKIASGIIGEIKNKKYQQQREKEPIDPKTGFHVKTEKLSPEEDIKRVNPQFNDLDAGTKNNCVLCSVTYELRKRGYDVQANRADEGYGMSDLSRWYKDVTVTPLHNSLNDEGKVIDSHRIEEDFEYRVKQQGEGASGILWVEWNKNGSAHAMHYEYRDGKIYINDPQTGTIYDNPHKVLKMTSGASIIRLDDKEVNWDGVKECCS